MESVLKMSVWFVVCICLAWNASASLESSYHRSLQPLPPNVFSGEAQADVLLDLLSFNNDVGVFLQEKTGILNGKNNDSVLFLEYLRDVKRIMNKDDTMISGEGLGGDIARFREMVQAMSTTGSAHAVDRHGMLAMKDILIISVPREDNRIELFEREELGSNVNKFGSLLNRRGSSGLRGEVGVLEGMGTSAQLDSFVSVLDPLGSLARGIANLTKIVYPFVDILVLPTQLVSSVIGSALSDFSKSLKQINIPGMMEASYFMELSASLMRIAELVQKSNATMGELSDEHGEMLSVMKSKGDSLFTFGGLLGNDTLSMFGAFEIVEDSYEYILDVLGAANNITNDGVPEWLNRDTAVRDSWMNLLDVRRVLELEGVIKRAIENIGEEAQPSSSGIFAWKPKMSHNSTKTGTTAGWAKPTLFPLEKTNLTNGFIKPTLFPVDLGSLKPFLKPTTTTTTGSTTTTRTADKSTTTSTTATTSSSTTSSSTTSSSTTSSSTTSSSTTSSTTASTTTTSTSTTRTTDKSTTRTTASTTRPSTTGGITVTTTAATEASATVGG
eukprot:GHVS01071346.1.p1 GENE.GHVS01071346.1~~GHVS01071346.1.p1  ORF type:complete len:556 (+),score=80.14 GHVS01071346.1:185-1852(+)